MAKNNDNTFSVAQAGDSSGFLLWQVTSLWQRGIRKALEPYDLTHSQFVILASIHWLTLQAQDVTQVVLSGHTKIDVMTTSTVLRTLQQKNLVIRTEHPTDTRAKIVKLTDAGKHLVKLAVVKVEQFDHEFFAVLGNKGAGFNKQLHALLASDNV
ncbi:MarR family winged helix-turn-helix transcriptional regulator [Chitinophaga sp. Cy-1792]|uniref:MarR family winged helix-turn-helix transcriptional regulator n=1 Tax=Chitinophaga sp. Cy-1792 TaxID=2608339 RepID=UPI0014222BBB|nr:MarR family transcriptional regulator [Chitinophaga sp. Cy-1792]NIG54143.1 MarR family transcriptional regulator [Chitinophaga sp. Cy-1792]